MRSTAVLLAAMLVAANVGAEPQGPPAPKDYRKVFLNEDRPRVNVWKPLLIHGSHAAFDFASTKHFQAKGIPEGNGIVRAWGLTEVKVGVALALSGLDMLAQRWAPDLVKPLRVLASVFYAAVGLHNFGASK